MVLKYKAVYPIPTLLLPELLYRIASLPNAVFWPPVVFRYMASWPIAVFWLPVVLECKPRAPDAVLKEPFVLNLNAPQPRPVLFSPVLLPERDLKPMAVFQVPVVDESSALNPKDVLLVIVSTYPERTLFTFMINGLASRVPIKLVAESVPELPDKLHPLVATMVSQSGAAAVPIFTINWFFNVSNTSNPLAGLVIAVIAAELIRGISRPFVPPLISRMALLSGVVVPMPIFCARQAMDDKLMMMVMIPFFINHFFKSSPINFLCSANCSFSSFICCCCSFTALINKKV